MNLDKCQLFISGNKFELLWTEIGNNKIRENRTVILLGLTIDDKIKFDEYLINVCLKTNRKISVFKGILSRDF